MNEKRYFESSKNWWRYDPKHIVVKRVKGKSVLDVGCSYGDLGIQLKNNGCCVDGVDFYEPALAFARKELSNVYKINLNLNESIDVISNKYDVVTFMDVLEHLIDPRDALIKFKEKLNPNGCVIASIPNVLNIKERIGFLLGKFEYKEYGVLDKTHLRFFTIESALKLFKNTFGNAKVIAYTPRYSFLNPVVNIWPELFALQVIIESRLEK